MMSSHQIEACAGCGRATQVGTRLFSDRRTTRLEDGTSLYLCEECNERAVSHCGRQPGQRDMVQIAARGAGIGMVGGGGWRSGGGR